MKATPELLAKLDQILDHASSGLKGVKAKKMFGCRALFVNGKKATRKKVGGKKAVAKKSTKKTS